MKRFVLLLTISFLLAGVAVADEKADEFLAAARKGDVAKVKSMLDGGVDVNTRSQYGATALSFACDRGNLDLVKLLIERGADVNAADTFYNATPLTWAADKGFVEIVRLLLDKGARGIDGVLMTGVFKGNVSVVKVALDKGGIPPQALNQALVQANAAGINRSSICLQQQVQSRSLPGSKCRRRH